MEAWPPDGLIPPTPRFAVRGGSAGREGVEGEPLIAPLSPDQAAEVAVAHGIDPARARRGPYRTLLHHPALAVAADGLLQRLLDKGVLEPRIREFVIMRVAWATGSAVEWARHWPYCQRLGIPPETVLALRDWRASGAFDAPARAALAATDETLATGTVGDAAWADVEAVLPTVPERLELVLAIANWRMYSQLLRSAGVPHEPTDEVWAPDGVMPA
jgi:alkylhydroperoxidase family enzyme